MDLRSQLSLVSLSDDLLLRLYQYLGKDILQLRLTNKQLALVGVTALRDLCYCVVLSPTWTSIARFKNICEHPLYREGVTVVKYTSAVYGETQLERESFHGCEDTNKLRKQYNIPDAVIEDARQKAVAFNAEQKAVLESGAISKATTDMLPMLPKLGRFEIRWKPGNLSGHRMLDVPPTYRRYSKWNISKEDSWQWRKRDTLEETVFHDFEYDHLWCEEKEVGPLVHPTLQALIDCAPAQWPLKVINVTTELPWKSHYEPLHAPVLLGIAMRESLRYLTMMDITLGKTEIRQEAAEQPVGLLWAEFLGMAESLKRLDLAVDGWAGYHFFHQIWTTCTWRSLECIVVDHRRMISHEMQSNQGSKVDPDLPSSPVEAIMQFLQRHKHCLKELFLVQFLDLLAVGGRGCSSTAADIDSLRLWIWKELPDLHNVTLQVEVPEMQLEQIDGDENTKTGASDVSKKNAKKIHELAQKLGVLNRSVPMEGWHGHKGVEDLYCFGWVHPRLHSRPR